MCQPDTSRMVLIPAGNFEMGASLGESSTEKPTQHIVWLDASAARLSFEM